MSASVSGIISQIGTGAVSGIEQSIAPDIQSAEQAISAVVVIVVFELLVVIILLVVISKKLPS